MGQEYLKLKLIPSEINIPTVARFIEDTVKPIGLTDHQSVLLCFAVESLLELRLRELGRDEPYVEISVTKNMEDICIAVRDKGTPYILTDNQRRILSRGLADSYRLEQLGSEGQRMSIYLKTVQDAELDFPEQEDETLLDTQFSIAPVQMDEQDVNEAIRCLYAVYGYEYLHQALYHVDHFRDVLTDGSFVASLVRNGHGQVLAMGALAWDADFPGLYEVSALATKPFARRQGVANRLVSHLLERMETLDANGIYACPVAYHTATQKICTASGMTPSGFMLHGFPPTSVGSFRDGDRRLDYAVCVHIRSSEQEHILYLPEEARALSVEIMEAEHLRYRLAVPDGFAPETRVSYAVDTFTSTTYITIDAAAEDFVSRIESILSDKAVSGCELLALFLNIEQPGAPAAYATLRERGFLFTGCFPGSNNGVYLNMEHLMGIPFERDKIQVTPEYGALLDRLLEINGCQ